MNNRTVRCKGTDATIPKREKVVASSVGIYVTPLRPASRIFIVDDHPLMRRALHRLLSLEPGLTLVGEAASAEEALTRLEGDPPDLLLIDFSLPGMDGAQFVRTLGRRHPGVCCLVISSHHETLYVNAALAAGAHGFVTKGDATALVGAIHRVLGGEIVVQTSF